MTTDFKINGVLLSNLLKVDRNSLSYCRNPSDHAFKEYIAELRGDSPPSNQYSSSRLPLYGCHCGCDYCGIISTRLQFEEKFVSWNDIRQEKDELGDLLLGEIFFDRDQYMAAINNFEEFINQTRAFN